MEEQTTYSIGDISQAQARGSSLAEPSSAPNYDFVDSAARIAVYDDLLSSPRIIDIQPDSTREFIHSLATSIYESAKTAGGSIPYSIILQVAENFIHSQFREVVVSVLDDGNTIRFSDQGPGIPDKEKAQQPGFSSATAPMKKYINGVGSGLPIVREYMETKHGAVMIEDNMDTGAVVTISLNATRDDLSSQDLGSQSMPASAPSFPTEKDAKTTDVLSSSPADPIEVATSMLSQRAFSILRLFVYESVWGVKDIADESGIPTSSTHSELKKLEEAGMMTRLGKKYRLTELGEKVTQNLF